MKTIKTLSALVLAAGIIFTSCKKKDSTPDPNAPVNNNPSINWIGGTGYTSTDVTVNGNDKVKFGYDATANTNTSAKLDSIFLTVTLISVTPNQVISSVSYHKAVNGSTGAATATGVDSLYAPTVSGKYNIQYTIHDKSGNTNSISFNVTVVNLADVNSGSQIPAGGSANSALGSYINLETGLVYLQSAAIAAPGNVELVYNDGKLYSPTDAAETNSTIHGGGKATQLQLSSYTSLSNVLATDVVNSNPTSTNVSISVNQVYYFSTNGKKGAFQVTALNPSSGSTDAVALQAKILQ